MGMPVPLYYTAEQLRAFPDDGNQYEVVHGELLVSPAPRLWHQEVVARLLETLRVYLRAERVGHAFGSPADISWGPDTLVQPDVFVVPLAQARTLDWAQIKDLLLVVEVLSPSSRRADRFTKRLEYQRQGIPLYWLVDPDEHQVEIWTPADLFPVFEREQLVWQPAGAAAPFSLSLAELFRPL
jgi:Uma2 family endonuclease